MKRILLLVLVALLPILASAYDAEIDGIYYNFSGDEAIVTYRDNYYNSYSGAVLIPEYVIFNNKTYHVTSIGHRAFCGIKSTHVTCAEAVLLTNALADLATSIETYSVTGYITEVVSSVRRNQQTFWMADTKDGGQVFEAYWANLPEGVTEFKVGSKVTITGQLMKYVKNGNVTPEIKNANVVILEEGDGGDQGGGDPVSCLVNGGFEEWVTDQEPTGWRESGSEAPGNATISKSSDAHSGSYACLIDAPESINKRLATQEMTLEAGSYTFSYYAKSTTTNVCQTRGGYVSVTGGIIGTYKMGDYANINNSNWTLVTYDFDLTEKTTLCLIVMNPKNSSYSVSQDILVDDVCLITTPKSVERNVDSVSLGNTQQTSFISSLTSVTIPSSVTNIGAYAFYGCSSLTSITIPNNVTSIGDYSFYGCNGLTSVILESDAIVSVLRTSTTSMKSIFGEQVTTYIIGNSVTCIGNGAFYGCKALTSITIPESVTGIGDYAFEDCTGLTDISIPNNVTNIGYNAFYGCSGLTSVTLQSNAIVSASSISMKSIFGEQVTTYIIGNNVTSIGADTFSGCSGLTSITIPESVTSIGSQAFEDCTGLTSITIPNSVTSIGNSAFYGCSGMTSVILESDAIVSASRTSSTSIRNIFGDQVKTYVIGNSVKAIGSYAFYNCSGMLSITIGSGISSIGYNAFYSVSPKKVIWLTNTPPSGYQNVNGTINYVANDRYSSLDNVVVYPFLSSLFEVDGVKYVPVSPSERTCDAIDYIYSAENLNINETVANKGISLIVKQIGPYLCYGNTSIKNVELNTTGDIGSQAFYWCTSLSNATINNQGSMGDYAFSGCSSLQTAILGQEITSVGSEAFSGCSTLESIVIPDSVTYLGSHAFENCSAITSAKIGNSITLIPDGTFRGCSSLTDIQIGTSVQTIGTYAFSNCSSLPTIQIPQNVAIISDYVFNGCKSLKTVLMDDGDAELNLGSNGSNPLFASCPLDSVYIGRNITYPTTSDKGYSPFYRNTTLRSVAITDQETEVSMNEFYGCAYLKNVRIGDGVTSIADWAFSGCSSLDYFAFGTSVGTIGQEAFSDCIAMTTLVSKAETPPVCGSQALDDINKWECTLMVPVGFVDAYQAAPQWREFFFIEIDPDAINNVMVKEGAEEVSRYDLNGRKINSLPSGTEGRRKSKSGGGHINIIRYSDGTTRKVLRR